MATPVSPTQFSGSLRVGKSQIRSFAQGFSGTADAITSLATTAMLRKLLPQWLSSWLRPCPRRHEGRRCVPVLEPLEQRLVPVGFSFPSGAQPSSPGFNSGPFHAVTVLSTPQTTSRAYPGFQPAYSRLFTGDFNGDGLDDVAGISSTGNVQVSLSNGTSFDQPTEWATLPASWQTIVVGDFTGDHMDDIAGLSTNGAWWIGISTGTSFVMTPWGSWPAGVHWVSVVTGDFTGTGTTAVAGLTASGTWWVGVPQQNGLQSQVWASWPGKWSNVLAGDFNGDGKTDVAAQNSNGVWWVGLSTGTGFAGRPWATWSAPANWAAIFVGDFNGDGSADIAGLANSGTWWVGLSTKQGFRTGKWGSWTGTWTKIVVGNFLGTGADQLAGLNANGIWWLLAANGSAFATQQEAQWPASMQWINVKTGDFDGAGADEVAGFGFNGKWYLGSASNQFAGQIATEWENGELPPYQAGAPWYTGFSRSLFQAIPFSIDQALFVNNAQTYLPFATYFEGTLTNWLAQANQQGITDLSDFQAFLAQQLTALFQTTSAYFQALYPGLSNNQYQLLMIMNLVHGHYQFGTVSTPSDENVQQLIALQEGCCTQEAALTERLAAIMGISGATINLQVNFHGPYGLVYAGHYIFYADGLWIDAETNTAYGINLDSSLGFTPDPADEPGSITYETLLSYSPYQRLQALLNLNLVYGFYDYLLKPDVRQQQINSGNDGGVIAFYYYHYLAGLRMGFSSLAAQAI